VVWSRFHQGFTSSFCAHRSQKHKNTVKSVVPFALLGSTCLKAAHKILVKLTPGFVKSAIQIISVTQRGAGGGGCQKNAKKVSRNI